MICSCPCKTLTIMSTSRLPLWCPACAGLDGHCAACDPGKVPSVDRSTCSLCTQLDAHNVSCFDYNFEASTPSCNECQYLKCVECNEGGRVEVAPGWARLPASARRRGLEGAVFRCKRRDSCAQRFSHDSAVACGQGYNGILCAGCVKDYYHIGPACVKCVSGSVRPGYLFLAAAIVGVIVVAACCGFRETKKRMQSEAGLYSRIQTHSTSRLTLGSTCQVSHRPHGFPHCACC